MIEIERKFLVTALPDGLSDELFIQQGYLAYEDNLEIRLRRSGDMRFLTIKEGSGLVRQETETEISPDQFDQLWPVTAGRRLEKYRSQIRIGAHKIDLDRYIGELAPLMVAEVEFASIEESERYEKPGFLGREITGVDAYKNLFLALHGLPLHSALDQQIAALPYLMRGKQLYIVLVTNSTQTRWIIPKGQQEPDMPRHNVAVMEALEEAGVIGHCTPRLHLACRQKGERTLHIYPLKVTTILKKWPEIGRRRRRVVTLDKALKMISDPELCRCIKRLSYRLQI